MLDTRNMRKVSFDRKEISAIKAAISNGAPYAERMSLGFAFRLLDFKQRLGEDDIVLREINALEGLHGSSSSTKPAEQFKRAPLHPFWHKHFSAPRHLLKNIGIRWGVDGQDGNRDLTQMIEGVAATHGDEPELWQKLLPYKFMMDGLQDRVTAKRMTGDWIVFAKHDGANYYLDLALHQEGRDDPDALMTKLRNGSAAEFPFLFQNAS